MKKLVFVGCSYTAGSGWLDIEKEKSISIMVKDSCHLWTNLCHQNIAKFLDLEQINVGQGGASNTEIFENAVKIISQTGKEIDTIFCQWTSMPRYNFNIGFELWDTSETVFINSRSHDVNLNRGDCWPREYIQDLLNRFKVLHHLHWEILKVINYSNILLNLSKFFNLRIFFINGICPWDENYFIQLKDVLPESYTNFTKKEILNIDTRDDQDIFKLYELAHQQYQEAGGINESHWINLYKSFKSLAIDTNFDGIHPGKKAMKFTINSSITDSKN